MKIFERADVIVLITEADIWTNFEEEVLKDARAREIPVIIVINKVDLRKPSNDFLLKLNKLSAYILQCNSLEEIKRDEVVNLFKKYLLATCPEGMHNPTKLVGDLVAKNGIAVLIVPIDLEAPKGRIILPQVQAIRDLLDHNAGALVVKESEYLKILAKLKKHPELVVCDSQVVHKMVESTPKGVKCTTFSILYSRFRGDLLESVKGLVAIKNLKDRDKVLIAEACSHHAIEDDIGRVKIPKWLKAFTGANLIFEVCSGHDYPQDLGKYSLIVHCGGCMINRREMLTRIQRAKEQKVPITNYGLAIALANGVLERVLSPFPEALKIIK
jgi:[FeFe] hydrogenase H-cluster maturation GTPase HydF